MARPAPLPAAGAARDLTPALVDQLRALHAAAAISEGFARSPVELGVHDTAVLAELRRRGLVGRRAMRTVRGGAMPLYWLTPPGLTLARSLAPQSPPALASGVRASERLFAHDRDQLALPLTCDALLARAYPAVAAAAPAAPSSAAPRLALAPAQADRVMEVVGIVSTILILAAMWRGLL